MIIRIGEIRDIIFYDQQIMIVNDFGIKIMKLKETGPKIHCQGNIEGLKNEEMQ